jgi:hypothetical protein
LPRIRLRVLPARDASKEAPMANTARTKAEEKLEAAQRLARQIERDRQKAAQAMTEKTARLRALRLAKEAADKQAAGKETPVPKAGDRPGKPR